MPSASILAYQKKLRLFTGNLLSLPPLSLYGIAYPRLKGEENMWSKVIFSEQGYSTVELTDLKSQSSVKTIHNVC
jgi:hypothetical protein